MLASETEKLYPASKTLVRDKVASRIHAKDHMLYAFDEGACECAADFMGWADLGTNPPYPCEKIQAFAAEAIADGIETVLLIGQGGSTQAPMTITKYNKIDRNAVDFKVLDSVSVSYTHLTCTQDTIGRPVFKKNFVIDAERHPNHRARIHGKKLWLGAGGRRLRSVDARAPKD